MNKQLFLAELNQYLAFLSQREREYIISGLAEKFEEAGPQAEPGLIMELGTPMSIAIALKRRKEAGELLCPDSYKATGRVREPVMDTAHPKASQKRPKTPKETEPEKEPSAQEILVKKLMDQDEAEEKADAILESETEYPEPGFSEPRYPEELPPEENYPSGVPAEGVYREMPDYQEPPYPGEAYVPESYQEPPYPAEAYAPEGYPEQPYPAEAYAPEGYPEQLYTGEGYTHEGYPEPPYTGEAYAPEGYQEQPYTGEAYASEGYQEPPYPGEGYAPEGYQDAPYPGDGGQEAESYAQEGAYTEEGYQDAEYTEEGYPPEGFIPAISSDGAARIIESPAAVKKKLTVGRVIVGSLTSLVVVAVFAVVAFLSLLVIYAGLRFGYAGLGTLSTLNDALWMFAIGFILLALGLLMLWLGIWVPMVVIHRLFLGKPEAHSRFRAFAGQFTRTMLLLIVVVLLLGLGCGAGGYFGGGYIDLALKNPAAVTAVERIVKGPMKLVLDLLGIDGAAIAEFLLTFNN